jgi:hypothetical protein
MFRWGVYAALGVLAVLAAAAAVYTTVLGLVGALMAIPVAAGLKVVLAERLQARDSADVDATRSEDGTAAPGSGATYEAPPSPAIRNADGSE